MVQFLFNSGFV